jgi:hypothetical protein
VLRSHSRCRSVPRRLADGFTAVRQAHPPAGGSLLLRGSHSRKSPRGIAPHDFLRTRRVASLHAAARQNGRAALRTRQRGREGRLLTPADSEPRDTRSPKLRPECGPCGVAEEYAISAAANPSVDQSAHRRSANPKRRRFVRPAPEGAVCHAAKRRPAGVAVLHACGQRIGGRTAEWSCGRTVAPNEGGVWWLAVLHACSRVSEVSAVLRSAPQVRRRAFCSSPRLP